MRRPGGGLMLWLVVVAVLSVGSVEGKKKQHGRKGFDCHHSCAKLGQGPKSSGVWDVDHMWLRERCRQCGFEIKEHNKRVFAAAQQKLKEQAAGGMNAGSDVNEDLVQKVFKYVAGLPEKTLKTGFERFDTGGNGKISTAELQTMIKVLFPATGVRPSQPDLKAMVGLVDTDADGSVSLDELLDAVRKAQMVKPGVTGTVSNPQSTLMHNADAIPEGVAPAKTLSNRPAAPEVDPTTQFADFPADMTGSEDNDTVPFVPSAWSEGTAPCDETVALTTPGERPKAHMSKSSIKAPKTTSGDRLRTLPPSFQIGKQLIDGTVAPRKPGAFHVEHTPKNMVAVKGVSNEMLDRIRVTPPDSAASRDETMPPSTSHAKLPKEARAVALCKLTKDCTECISVGEGLCGWWGGMDPPPSMSAEMGQCVVLSQHNKDTEDWPRIVSVADQCSSRPVTLRTETSNHADHPSPPNYPASKPFENKPSLNLVSQPPAVTSATTPAVAAPAPDGDAVEDNTEDDEPAGGMEGASANDDMTQIGLMPVLKTCPPGGCRSTATMVEAASEEPPPIRVYSPVIEMDESTATPTPTPTLEGWKMGEDEALVADPPCEELQDQQMPPVLMLDVSPAAAVARNEKKASHGRVMIKPAATVSDRYHKAAIRGAQTGEWVAPAANAAVPPSIDYVDDMDQDKYQVFGVFRSKSNTIYDALMTQSADPLALDQVVNTASATSEAKLVDVDHLADTQAMKGPEADWNGDVTASSAFALMNVKADYVETMKRQMEEVATAEAAREAASTNEESSSMVPSVPAKITGKVSRRPLADPDISDTRVGGSVMDKSDADSVMNPSRFGWTPDSTVVRNSGMKMKPLGGFAPDPKHSPSRAPVTADADADAEEAYQVPAATAEDPATALAPADAAADVDEVVVPTDAHDDMAPAVAAEGPAPATPPQLPPTSKAGLGSPPPSPADLPVDDPAQTATTAESSAPKSKGLPIDMTATSVMTRGANVDHEAQLVLDVQSDALTNMPASDPLASTAVNLRGFDSPPVKRISVIEPMRRTQLAPSSVMPENGVSSLSSIVTYDETSEVYTNDPTIAGGGDEAGAEARSFDTARPCSTHDDCGACTFSPHCVWCPAIQVCVAGDSDGPTVHHACKASGWLFDSCEALAGGSKHWARVGGADKPATSAIKRRAGAVQHVDCERRDGKTGKCL